MESLIATATMLAKKNFTILLFASGVISSIVTWWGNGKPHTFWGWAVPNAITNGIFGTTLALALRMWKPEMSMELLFFISASAGSLGKYAVVKLLSSFFGLDRK